MADPGAPESRPVPYGKQRFLSFGGLCFFRLRHAQCLEKPPGLAAIGFRLSRTGGCPPLRIGKSPASPQQRRQADQVAAQQVDAEHSTQPDKPPAVKRIVQPQRHNQSCGTLAVLRGISLIAQPLCDRRTDCADCRQQHQQADGKRHGGKKSADLFHQGSVPYTRETAGLLSRSAVSVMSGTKGRFLTFRKC